MQQTLDFDALLRLIEEQATTFRAVIASAPGLEAPVPTCPEWTLLDLVQHLGAVHRAWATIVTAGPADERTAASTKEIAATAPSGRADLMAWSAESAQLLLEALRAAGPDRGCWSWWVGSQSPRTAGAVARHQVQELTVHTYDAQAALGAPQPLPREAAVDGVDEFLCTCVSVAHPWPFEPAVIEYRSAEGGAWRVAFGDFGARVARVIDAEDAEPGPAPDLIARGTSSDHVLAFYGRTPIESLELTGDKQVMERLRDWEPGA